MEGLQGHFQRWFWGDLIRRDWRRDEGPFHSHDQADKKRVRVIMPLAAPGTLAYLQYPENKTLHYGLNCVFLNLYVEVPTPTTSGCALIWK